MVSSLLLWGQVLPLTAQEEVPRPRVGLALSGGGARGMAHIGVLRWFEENRIPVDYIAGTSMGGLVAGMYATGMTPDGMAALVENTNWNAVLSGSPLYPELTFRRKEDQHEFATAIEFGIRDGIRFPRGLNDGHAIGLIFDRVTLPYASIESFDELPIPFRVLATELVSGRLVVFDRGSLSEALRATMALPGIFTPIDIGDRIYADGGLLNNIPTDVVRQMGAEVVIAINVGSPLLEGEELDDLFGVLSQSVAVMGIESARRTLELADIVLTPDLEDYTLLDFIDSAAIIELGYGGVDETAATLGTLSLDDDAWQRHLDARRSRTRVSVTQPSSVEVVGVGSTASTGISERLQNHLNRPMARERLEQDLTRIVGNGRFASLGYEVSPDGRLIVDAREKIHGPPFVVGGLDAEASTGGLLNVSMGLRVIAMDVGGVGAEWRTDLKLGTQDVAATEYFRPLGRTRLFVAPRAWWVGSSEDLFDNGARIAKARTRQRGVGFDVGYSLNRFSEIRAGYEMFDIAQSIQTGDPLLPTLEGNLHSAFVRWVYDGYDQPIIPTRGVYAASETRWFSEESGLAADLVRSELNLSTLQPVSPRASIFLTAAGGRTYRRDALPFQQFTLGGSFRLSAWDRGEFRDGRFALGSIGYLRDLVGLPPLFGDRLYSASFYEIGRLFSETHGNQVLHDVALAFGMRSPLGAVWAGAAWGEGGQAKLFFRIGRVF